jgi:hypothetical protein
MRYRPLSASGDFTIGQRWLVNSPQCVEQAISTRMKLWLGEWFLDVTDGTPYLTQVLGERYNKSPDAAIKRRILGTPGVSQLIAYSSSFNAPTDSQPRTLTVNARVQTIYSVTPVSVSLPLTVAVP